MFVVIVVNFDSYVEIVFLVEEFVVFLLCWCLYDFDVVDVFLCVYIDCYVVDFDFVCFYIVCEFEVVGVGVIVVMICVDCSCGCWFEFDDVDYGVNWWIGVIVIVVFVVCCIYWCKL